MAQVRNREHGRDGMKLRSFELRADTIATLERVERTQSASSECRCENRTDPEKGIRSARPDPIVLPGMSFVCMRDVSVLASNWLRLKIELKAEYPLRD